MQWMGIWNHRISPSNEYEVVLHNGMVCSHAVTQAFIRLSKSGSTRAMVTGCQYFRMPVHCIWSGSNTLYVFHMMCKQLWMGMEPQPLHNGMVCSPAVTQAYSRLSKSRLTRAMVTGCRCFHIPIHCIQSGSNTLYVKLINLKRTLFDLAGTKNSSWTDRPRKSGRFEIKRFYVLSTLIIIKHAISSDW